MVDPIVVASWRWTYINNNWCINNGPQGSLMPDDPRSIYNPNISGEDIASQLRSVHPTEHQYHFNQVGTNVTRYYFGGFTGAAEPYTQVTQEIGSVSWSGDGWYEQANENPIDLLNDSWSAGDISAGNFWLVAGAGYQTPHQFANAPFFIDAASAYTYTACNGVDGYRAGVYRTSGNQSIEGEVIVDSKTGYFCMDNKIEHPGVKQGSKQH